MRLRNQRYDCRTITLDDAFIEWIENKKAFSGDRRPFGEFCYLFKFHGWIIL